MEETSIVKTGILPNFDTPVRRSQHLIIFIRFLHCSNF